MRYNEYMASKVLLVFLLASWFAVAQTRPVPPPPRSNRIPPEVDRNMDIPTPLNSPAKLLKQQHEEVKKDMEKLSKLVEEIQEELEKAGENVLPLNSLKKLEEVERLARKVRSRLKQ